MDPLIALGLASNIVQCVQVNGKIISQLTSRPLQRSSSLSCLGELVESLSFINHELNRHSERVQGFKLSKAERKLEDLCQESKSINDEVIQCLEDLQVESQRKKFGNAQQAFTAIWKESDINLLEKRLENLRKQTDTAALTSLEKHVHDDVLESGTSSTLTADFDFTEGVRQHHESVLESVRLNNWHAANVEDLKHFSRLINKSSELALQDYFDSYILAHLEFNDMGNRRDHIPQAHETTFEWLYRSSQEGEALNWTDFSAWLKTSTHENLYWITGKAGSGKSTLMKHVYSNPMTHQYLQEWAGDTPFETAGFFFWNSGAVLQMSRVGLLRSLLHQILLRRPALICRVFPNKWADYNASGSCGNDWTWTELKAAFEKVISVEGLKFAFFLDGLDEFDGDLRELTELVLTASKRRHVKICSASRPWQAFEKAFGKPSLLLENLTERDIRQYILDEFRKNKESSHFLKQNHEKANDLINAITAKASGVFLWVDLVVDALIAGFKNTEKAKDPMKRLVNLPQDLNDLFQTLLSAQELYRFSRACQMLALLSAAQEPPTLFAFAIADNDDSFRTTRHNTSILTATETERLLESTANELEHVCKPLVKVAHFKGRPSRVIFLHRTVKDFVSQNRFASQIWSEVGSDFDPHRRLANGYLREIQVYQPDIAARGRKRENQMREQFTSIAMVLEYALQSERHTGQPLVEYLDTLGKIIIPQWGNGDIFYEITGPGAWSKTSTHAFLLLALACGHFGYFRLKVDPKAKGTHTHLPQAVLTDLLDFALKDKADLPSKLSEFEAISFAGQKTPKEVVNVLLDADVDPNEVITSSQELAKLDQELQDVLKPHLKISTPAKRPSTLARIFKSKSSDSKK